MAVAPRMHVMTTLGSAGGAVGVFLGPAPLPGFVVVRLSMAGLCATVDTLVPSGWVHPVQRMFGESMPTPGGVSGGRSAWGLRPGGGRGRGRARAGRDGTGRADEDGGGDGPERARARGLGARGRERGRGRAGAGARAGEMLGVVYVCLNVRGAKHTRCCTGV